MTDDEKAAAAKAELEQLNAKTAKLKAEIAERDALRDLRLEGERIGLDPQAPVAHFIDDYLKSGQTAESWLRSQLSSRPYWFSGATNPIVNSLPNGDPFDVTTYDLGRQRELLKLNPEAAAALLRRRGLD